MMRVADRHIRALFPSIELSFDGVSISGFEGESLAACLMANGFRNFRTTKSGAARGVFCGMGVCSDCLVEVDGCHNLNACMTPVTEGMNVKSQVDPVELSGSSKVNLASDPEVETKILRPEILVLGGGPAGLSAAKAAALAGCEVSLIDERLSLGGQYFKQLLKNHVFDDDRHMDQQFKAGRELISEVEAAGVRVYGGALVWGAFEPMEICVVEKGRSFIFQPANLIIATGAYERGVPLPGWTLPGFMTTGAAQTLLRSYRVAPGRKVLVAGNGPLNLQVAAELSDAGVEVVAVAEAAAPMSLSKLPAMLSAFQQSPDLMFDGLSYLRRLRRARVPLLLGHVVIEASGREAVESVAVAAVTPEGGVVAGSRRDLAVDAVCVGYGFLPANEISRALGCRHRFDPALGSLVVEKDGDCQSSVKGIFIVGDCGGMGGAKAAIEEGFIAGVAAARNMRRDVPSGLARELVARRRRLVSHRRFQRALWRLFSAPQLDVQLAREDTLVCRCEEVTLAEIQGSLDGGACTAGAVKRETRAGMGRCQGRYCGSLITELVAKHSGIAAEEFSFFAPRPPIKPVPINLLARETPDGLTSETVEGSAMEMD